MALVLASGISDEPRARLDELKVIPSVSMLLEGVIELSKLSVAIQLDPRTELYGMEDSSVCWEDSDWTLLSRTDPVGRILSDSMRKELAAV